jgi:fido (protein-threonine AMPylation protein)
MAKYNMMEPKPRHWPELVKLGLLPGVDSVEEYEARVSLGMLKAVQEVKKKGGYLDYHAAEAEHIHQVIFGEVHPWAGKPRKPGEAVMIGGKPGAHPDTLHAEQFMLLEQGLMLREKTPRGWVDDGVARAAFLHARFERIHPFRDGNGRVGRVLLYGHLLAAGRERGQRVRLPFLEREEYIKGLVSAENGDLTYLANVIRTAIKRPVEFVVERSPFQIAPVRPGPVVERPKLERGDRNDGMDQREIPMIYKG